LTNNETICLVHLPIVIIWLMLSFFSLFQLITLIGSAMSVSRKKKIFRIIFPTKKKKILDNLFNVLFYTLLQLLISFFFSQKNPITWPSRFSIRAKLIGMGHPICLDYHWRSLSKVEVVENVLTIFET
jgi:hypothetical protein